MTIANFECYSLQGSRRCGSHTSKPARSARYPNVEMKRISSKPYQIHHTTKKQDGQTARAGRSQRTPFLKPNAWTHPKKESTQANGERYLRVGGTRQRCFAGTSFQPRKLPENAQSPTRRVHAVLGTVLLSTYSFCGFSQNFIHALLKYFNFVRLGDALESIIVKPQNVMI